MIRFSAPSAPFPHLPPQGAETAINPHRRTTFYRGAGVRCGDFGAAEQSPSEPEIFRTTGGIAWSI